MVHLNDSKSPLGSRLDRHEHIGAGGIGERGMAHLLTHPLLAHVPAYLETPGMDEGYDAINMARAHALASGRPLDPLPPGAMSVRGSRSRTAAQAEPESEGEGEAGVVAAAGAESEAWAPSRTPPGRR
jgi:hypothetical protein